MLVHLSFVHLEVFGDSFGLVKLQTAGVRIDRHGWVVAKGAAVADVYPQSGVITRKFIWLKVSTLDRRDVGSAPESIHDLAFLVAEECGGG